MILVTVGTHPAPFDRLLREVDRLHKTGALTADEPGEDVVIQSGASPYRYQATRQFAYCPGPELDGLLTQARLVISHGGIGTLLPAVRRGQHVIAVPRLRRYREHHDDHQRDVCDELARRRALFTSPDVADLAALLHDDPATLRPFAVACTIREQVRADLLALQDGLRAARP